MLPAANFPMPPPEDYRTLLSADSLDSMRERTQSLVRRSLSTSRPMIWNNAVFRQTPAIAAFYEEARLHGASTDCTCPASLPGG